MNYYYIILRIRWPSQLFGFVSLRSLSRLHCYWWFSEHCETRRFFSNKSRDVVAVPYNYQPSTRIEITFWENAILRTRRIIFSFVFHISHEVQESHRRFVNRHRQACSLRVCGLIKQPQRVKFMFYENGSCWRVYDFSVSFVTRLLNDEEKNVIPTVKTVIQ